MNETIAFLSDFQLKPCSTCGEYKRDTEEYFPKGRTKKDGTPTLKSQCKLCSNKTSRQWHLNNIDKVRERSREYQRSHKEERQLYEKLNRKKHTDSVRKRRFGIESHEYDRLFTSQLSGCAICGYVPNVQEGDKWLAVDHNHYTDEIRELLCTRCNTLLGSLKSDNYPKGDDFNLLMKFVYYLQKHQNRLP